MADQQVNPQLIAFKSGALPNDIVELRGFVGRERLSRLFDFDLILLRPEPYTDDQIDDLLRAPCAIAMGRKDGEIVHGILSSIQLWTLSTRSAAYMAKMVPNAWLTTLARTNRLFQNMSVPDMVKASLERYGLVAETDFRINAWSKSAPAEYVVQYEESDWDFIQRWLEHEGYFYWFEHGDQGETLIVAHENSSCPPIAGAAAVPYRDKNNLLGPQSVSDWRPRFQRIPARVSLFDYNYRKPGNRLIATSDVDTKRGFGGVFLYGEHFKDQPSGDAIAAVRAERFRSERLVIEGQTDCARFRVGHTFELENHSAPDQDGKYLIIALEHRAGYDLGTSEVGDTGLPYRATFEAIPLDVAYRPPQLTPWPSIHGVIHAHVDADTGGEYAQLDSQGRYKVKLPFDGTDAKGSGASRWVRMAQHYSGAGYGSHFPLHKGAEVLLAHIDGDPDRPIIVASVPNPHTLTPSTSSNATQSVIHTASGIRIEMEDNQG